MIEEQPLSERELSSLPGLSGFQINPLFRNGVKTIGDFERLGMKELSILWGVGTMTIKKVQDAIDIERRRSEPSYEVDIERLYEIAKSVYTNWACGEPIDEDMTKLGKLLGVEVNIP